MKIITCPYCEGKIELCGFGRKPLDITVKNVYDALEKHGNVAAAAEELGCSRAYIYRILKQNGRSVKDFVDPVEQRKSKRKHN